METELYYIEGFEVFKKQLLLLPKSIKTSLDNTNKNIIDKVFDNGYIIHNDNTKYYKTYEVAKLITSNPQIMNLDDKTKVKKWLETKILFFNEMEYNFNCTSEYLIDLGTPNEHINLVINISKRVSTLSQIMSEIINMMINNSDKLENYMKTIMNSYMDITNNTQSNKNINDNTLLYYVNNLKNIEDIFFFELVFIIKIQDYMRETMTNNTMILKKVLNTN